MPAVVQQILRDERASRDFEEAEYKAVFANTFIYPGSPQPPELLAAFKHPRHNITGSSTA